MQHELSSQTLTHFMDIRLHPMKRCIATAFVDQLVVRSILHQPAAIDGDDAIASAHGGQAVGDDEDGAALGDARHVVLNDALALVVERTGGFVEDEDTRVADQRTRNRQALTLATGEGTAVLAHRGIVPFG